MPGMEARRYRYATVLRSNFTKIVDIEPEQRHRLYNRISLNTEVTLENMKKDKLKSTTVRCTREDFHIIGMLQRRLGLGMVQVIRVAIRRLAQLEKVAVSLPKVDDR